MAVTINGHEAGNVYLSSSPPPLCTNGRTTDIDSILDVIHKAKKFIHVSVMDYSPTFLYIWPEKYVDNYTFTWLHLALTETLEDLIYLFTQ